MLFDISIRASVRWSETEALFVTAKRHSGAVQTE